MANSRQTLPPLGARKGSKGSEERTGSTGSTKVGGQRRPSGREADRPSAPLRVQIAGASHEVAGAEKKPMVLLELKGISFEDLTDYRIQWRSLLPWVLEKDGTDIKDFSEDAYLHDPFLAVPLQLPGLIQLRMFQKKFPDNIAAWNDWCRAAKKEMEWLWRSCDPFPVHLPAPNPLGVSLEVSEEDGASLVVFLSFALPRDVSVPDDVPLHWQYRWRDATFGHGQEDCCVDSFETLLKERGTPRVRSPALRGDWECTSVIFSVRYLLGSSWSAWSDFASGSPNWAPWQGQPKLSISSCGFTKAILSLASPACVGHVKAQIRIEVGQVQGAMQTVLVTERPSFQAQTFTCPLRALRPGNSYTVRVSSRRWRIDHEWQEQLQELQQPLTGSEQGVPPMWALAPGMLEEVHVDGDLDWYPFWLHPIIASWPMDGVSAEWRREAPGEEWWTLTACERSSLHAARQKDARLAKGSGLRILLPKLTTWILVRLRHTCGLVTSSTRIRPSLLPLQEKPLATLVAKDSGLAIQLSLAEDHCGTMIQFMATAESKINKGDVGAQISHELEPCCLRPLADEAPVRHLVDVEELRMSPVEAVAFQARIGDGRQWSAWSPASDLLGLRIAPPVPDRGELTVQELAKGVVEVLWSKFRRLEGLEEVHYEVTATCAGFLQERVCLLSETEATHSGQLAGSCRAVFERLVPDTDYDFVVKGIYPKLKHFTRCAEDAEEAGAASPVLKASLRLKGVDGRDFEPPQAVKQVAPPPLYGGADRRSPYSFEFWIEVDSHVSSSSYVVEWRAWPGETWQAAALKALGQEDGQERPAGSTEPKDSQGLKVEQFIWDCGPSPPEGVELRVRAAAPSMQRSSRGWFSPISGPFATAFAVPEKPKATLLVSEPHLAVAITFALGGPSSVPGPTEPAGPVALGHGHCLARRVQICYRRAGDADEEVVEMKPRELRLQSRSDLSASAENSVPSGGELVMIPATQPRFWEGQRLLFAVRIGDEYRWSAWSSFSKPVHMKHAVLRAAPVSTGLIAKPLSPERVGLQWSSCVALAGVEYMVSMVQFGATGREVKSTGQLMALWAEDGLDREGIELDIDIGRVRPGASLQFRLLARTQRHTLGTPCFEELARSEVLVWPSWSGVSGGAAVSAAGTACLAAESWDLPVPHLLAVPEELDATGRWRGRAVLLSWPKGVPVGDADEVPLELQACCWDAEKEEFSDAHGWVPVSWSLLHVHGLPCIAASQLPFTSLRLRWYSCDRCVAGPCSEACLSLVDTAEVAVCQVLCTVSAVQVEASFQHRPSGEKSSIMAQWRFQAVQVSQADEPGCSFSSLGEWCVLDHHIASSSDRRHFTGMDGTERRKVLIGEDEGLELGTFYVFSVRVSDGRRSSAWSACSRPVLFDVPEAHAPVPRGPAPHRLLVEPLTPHSVRCWWPRMEVGCLPLELDLLGEGQSSGARPTLDYRLDVSRCVDGGLERHCTILLSDEDEDSHVHGPGEASVTGLCPEEPYFAAVAVRFARLGRRDWRRTGLSATFTTSRAG